MPDRRVTVLRWVLTFAVVSTALHFTHNFVAVDQYPRASWQSAVAIQVAIVVSWPLFTLLALAAYRRYAAGRHAAAHPLLAAYAVLPLTTPLHFTAGNPDVPAFWYATIFTDGLAGLLVLAFVAWSARRSPQPA
jgi:hypothetical protein